MKEDRRTRGRPGHEAAPEDAPEDAAAPDEGVAPGD